MSRQEITRPSLPSRLVLHWKCVYKELQYWLLGHSPEHYHHYKAYIHSELCDFTRAVKHYRAYLTNTNDPRIRANLGMTLATLERWPEALAEYQKVELEWPHPAVVLAIAEAHVRLGDREAALRQITKVDAGSLEQDPALKAAREDLMKELQ
jgi:tetratricopeptide (TPR) repeat protein